MSEVLKEFLIDFSVNVYETIAGFSLILGLFRFSFNKTYFINTLIAAVVMAQTSYLLRFPLDLPFVTSFFMLVWIFLFLWRLFRIHPFYASLMAVTGYMTYITIQEFLLIFASLFVGFEKIIGNFHLGKTLQVGSSSVSFLVYFLLLRKRIGFSFVPDKTEMKIKLDYIHRMLLMVTILSAFVICFTSFLAINFEFVMVIISATFMGVLIYLTYLNERSKTNTG